MAEGGLSERARRRATELAGEVDIRMTPPAEIDLPAASGSLPKVFGRVAATRDPRLPAPGTVLTRLFKGHEYHVTVLPNGFEFDGQAFRSLSAVTYAISGLHWNGYHFVQLPTPTRKGKEDATWADL